MGTNIAQHILRHLAVTVAFAAGSIVITSGIWLIFSTDTRYFDPLTASEWLRAGVATFTLSVLSGLVVDAIQLVGRLEWPKESMPRLPSRETLGSELL